MNRGQRCSSLRTIASMIAFSALLAVVVPALPRISFAEEGGGELQIVLPPPLVWDDNPGAHEQHLKRRYQNPLFPAKRRQVTQAEIDVARTQDLADAAMVRKDFLALLDKIAALPSPSSKRAARALSYREPLDAIVFEAAGIGGKADRTKFQAREIRTSIIESVRRSAAYDPTVTSQLREAENYWHSRALELEVPFIAQMGRNPTPFPDNELFISLLSEDSNTIAVVIDWIEDPTTKRVIQAAALREYQRVLLSGGDIPDLAAKLDALDLPMFAGRSS